MTVFILYMDSVCIIYGQCLYYIWTVFVLYDSVCII